MNNQETEIETYESMDELNYTLDYDSEFPTVKGLEKLEKKVNDPRVQAMFKRSRHSTTSIFIISQGCYELPKNLLGLLVLFNKYSNQTVSKMFKSFIWTKAVETRHLQNN